MSPPPMDEFAAALLRATVWPRWMPEYQLYYQRCACQYGLTGHCSRGTHDKCIAGSAPAWPHNETHILTRKGYVASFRQDYEHPTGSATGWRKERYAMVWIKGYSCRYVCPCDCHAYVAPTAPQHTDAPTDWAQSDLFALMET